jgi:hypothetical protein
MSHQKMFGKSTAWMSLTADGMSLVRFLVFYYNFTNSFGR